MFEHVHSKIVPSTKTPNTQIDIAKVKYNTPKMDLIFNRKSQFLIILSINQCRQFSSILFAKSFFISPPPLPQL